MDKEKRLNTSLSTIWRGLSKRAGLVLMILMLLGSIHILRGIDKPWRRPAAPAFYEGDTKHIPWLEKAILPIRKLMEKGEAADQLRANLEFEQWVQLGLWYGALGFSLFVFMMLIGWRWWQPLTKNSIKDDGLVMAEKPGESFGLGWRASRWSVGVLIIAVVIGAATRLPYLGRSLLWDEQDNLRRSYHGFEEIRSFDTPPIWHEATMAHALWENERGNNPVMMSVTAQVSNKLWRTFSGADRKRFNPVVMRLPVAVAGLMGIVTLWWMMNLMGMRQAAAIGAMLAALHPMHIEYSIEARGYGFILMLAPLATGAGYLAWKRGKWLDYWIMGSSLVLCLMAYPGAFYFVFSINALLACGNLWIWLGKKESHGRMGFARHMVSGSFLAAGFAWLLAPYIPQMLIYMSNSFQKGYMPTWWYFMTWQMYASGLMFIFPQEYFLLPPWESPSLSAWSVGVFFKHAPILAIWSLILVPCLLITGFNKLWKEKQGRMPWALMAATMVSGILCIVHHAAFSGNFIYGWYIIFILPAFLAILANGGIFCVDWMTKKSSGLEVGKWSWLAWGIPVFLAILTHPMLGNKTMEIPGVEVARRPVNSGWEKVDAGFIGMVEFQRARNLWVVYEDGVQWYFPNYQEHESAVRQKMRRYLSKEIIPQNNR